MSTSRGKAKAPTKPAGWTPHHGNASYVDPRLSQDEIEALRGIQDAAIETASRATLALRSPCPSNFSGLRHYIANVTTAIAQFDLAHDAAEAWRSHERFRTEKGTCPSLAHLTAEAKSTAEERERHPPEPHSQTFVVNDVRYCETCRKRKVMTVPSAESRRRALQRARRRGRLRADPVPPRRRRG